MASTFIKQLSSFHTEHPLCDICLARLGKEYAASTPMETRGSVIRKELGVANPVPVTQCWLCQGIFTELDKFIALCKESLQPYEFDTFLVGTKIDEAMMEREVIVQEHLRLENPEPLKMELNRCIGKQLEHDMDQTVSFTDPDIIIVVDTRFDVVDLQIKSMYLYGRYQKKQRGLPQTRWPCRVCRGVGCRACSMTGKQYHSSVEELIAQPILEQVQGTSESFHGAGREDVDALMLGTGRPFVLEIKEPKKRTIDCRSLENSINTNHSDIIEVTNLRLSSKEEIIRLKQATFHKQYRVEIHAETPLKKEKLKEVAQLLPGTTIQQYTPTRVAHRRAEKCRQRALYQCTVEQVEGTRAVLVLETESGTYVKEFVSGDNGRTTPNLSDLLNTPCTVTALDVIAVQGE